MEKTEGKRKLKNSMAYLITQWWVFSSAFNLKNPSNGNSKKSIINRDCYTKESEIYVKVLWMRDEDG